MVLRGSLACALSIALTLALPFADAVAAGGSSPDDLIGLWKAKKWFGPHARGPLVIQRSGATYTADMVGRTLPVRADHEALSFELPDGQGTFRGTLKAGGIILGHWFPPHHSTSGSVYASPLQLKPDGPNRWRGAVVPFEDVFTFYLMAQKRPDGSIGVLLRNPERDYGAQIGVERLTRDGNVVKLFGKRRGEKEDRELASGTFDAEQQRLTLVFPNRGGSYDFTRDNDASGFYPRGKHPSRYAYVPPPQRDDGWSTATLEQAAIDRSGLERFIQKIVDMPMDTVAAFQIHGILITRHGKLVVEEYFHGEHRDKPHETRSAAKSLTATIVGAAMQAGAPLELSTPVYQIMNGGKFPPDLEPRKRAMTLEHLLTMSSGYFCDDIDPAAPGNEEVMLDQTDEPDYYRFTLKVPMASAPGEKAVYCSGNPNLALGVVSRATGESPLDTFDRLLAAPMKMSRYGWPLDPAGNPYGGGAVQLLPRDFMKLGQLMLNGGTWQGRRILSRDFVARASAPLYHLRGITYGYLWWGIDYPYKDRKVHAFYAGGAGGQSVTVVPELDLVVAIYGGNYSSGGIRRWQELVPRHILPAVREPGDDKSAPVGERDYSSPYGPSPIAGPVVPSPSQEASAKP